MDIRWVSEGKVHTAGVDELPALCQRHDVVVWADFHYEDPEMDVLSALGFHHLAIDECRTRTPIPKVHVYSDHLFVALNGLTRGRDGGLHFLPIKAFIGLNALVTVHGPVHESVDPDVNLRHTTVVRGRLDDGRLQIDSVGQLTHDIVIGMARAIDRSVTELATATTELERKIKVCDPVRIETLLDELFDLRHDLQTIRTGAAQSREVFIRILETPFLPPESVPYVEDLSHEFDHLTNISDLEREYLQELLDLSQTRVASELNMFVRKLTSWGAIGIASTLVAGVYGMNFEHMPELSWQFGYPLAIGTMVVIGLALAAVFRRRGWL